MTRVTSHALNADGLWCQILNRSARGHPALFLDRDGTIIVDTGYLRRVEDIAVIPRAAKVIAAANHRNIPVVMVTNQAGIGRGYYTWTDFKLVQEAIVASLAAEDA